MKLNIKPDDFLKATVITVLAFSLSLVLMQPFSLSIATLISSNDRHDFNITDFYNIIADGRAVRTLDRDIVIVDIKDATREDVAVVLDFLPALEPRAVGLDVMFDVPRDNDSLLLSAVANMPEMVMIVDVEGDSERGAETFHMAQTSFFHDSLGVRRFGASNLPTKYEGGVVREFSVDFPVKDGKAVSSFPVALAEAVDSSAVAELRARGLRLENINYPSRTFKCIPWYDIASYAEDIQNHIVLLGAVGVPEDMHATPTQKQMSGIEIHAHALSTILNRNYLDTVGTIGNLAIAFALCFILAMIHLRLPAEFKSLALRLIQLILLYFIIRIGYYFFIDRSIIVNFSYTLLMMTFVLFACDIWFGVNGTIKFFKKKLQSHKQATNQ